MMDGFDTFLSHNSDDKAAVEAIARRLRSEGVEPWLDKWNLVPGEPWMEAIEQALDCCSTCTVFIGPSGLGPWQNAEMRAAIDRRVTARGFRVIPVLLPGAQREERSRLPTFLTQATWVEFHDDLSDETAFRRLVSGIRGLAPGPEPEEEVYESCPYRGLEVFEREHARFFFGQEALTGWLLDALRPKPGQALVNRFLSIVGASGSGKSSLARAGLLPALGKGAIADSESWRQVILKPGPRPLESLATALVADPVVRERQADVSSLEKGFAEDTAKLHKTVRLALHGLPENRRAVVLVDQFEEVFTLCDEAHERKAFIENLLHAASEALGQTIVILTLRADFYVKCAQSPALAAALADHQVLVSPMTEEELRRAIEEPARLAGREIENGLTEILIRDLENQPGALPLLQYALTQLWEHCTGRRLTVAGYHAIGGLEGALETRANLLYEELDTEQKEICRRILLRLTQPGVDAVDTKRRVPRKDLDMAGPAMSGEVVQKLSQARLITLERDPARAAAQSYVEISHEALIRGWARLHEWIEEGRDDLKIQHRLSEAAAEWEAHERDEAYLFRGARLAGAEEWAGRQAEMLTPLEREFVQRGVARRDEEKRRLRRRRNQAVVVGALAVLAALAAVAAWLQALSQSELADRRARIAEARELAAQAQSLVPRYPRRATLMAVEGLRATAVDGFRVPTAEEALRHALSYLGGRELTPVERKRLPFPTTAEPSSPLPVPIEPVRSDDGRWLASPDEGGYRLVDTLSQTSIILSDSVGLPTFTGTYEPHFSLDSRWFLGVVNDPTLSSGIRAVFNRILVWDLENPQEEPRYVSLHREKVSIRSQLSRRWLLSASADRVNLWDLELDEPFSSPVPLRGSTEGASAFDLANDKWLALGFEDHSVRLWDLEDTNRDPRIFYGHESPVTEVHLGPENRWLLSADDSVARLWDLDRAAPAFEPVALGGHDKQIRTIAIHGETGDIFTGASATQDDNEPVRRWTLQPQGTVDRREMAEEMHATGNVALSGDGRWLVVTSSYLSDAQVYDLRFPDRDPFLLDVVRLEAPFAETSFSSDNRWLVLRSAVNMAGLWELDGESSAVHAVDLGGESRDIVLDPENRWMLVHGFDDQVRPWDLSGELPRPAPNGADVVREIRFPGLAESDGRLPGGVRVWQTQDEGAILVTVPEDVPRETRARASPDGNWLLFRESGSWQLWNLAAGKRAAGFDPSPLADQAGFSSDSRWLAAWGGDDAVDLWDLRDPDSLESRRLEGHEGTVRFVELVADSHCLISVGDDATVRLWDLTRLDERAVVLRGHEHPISALAVDFSRRRLVTGDERGRVLVWRLWDAGRDPSARLRSLIDLALRMAGS